MATIRLRVDFRDFLKLLNSHRVEYLQIGGYAVSYHGHFRHTNDINFWIAVNPENMRKILLIHEVLKTLAKEDELKTEIVKLKFFAGLKSEEIAHVLDLSEKTVRRHWNVTKARLYQIIKESS